MYKKLLLIKLLLIYGSNYVYGIVKDESIGGTDFRQLRENESYLNLKHFSCNSKINFVNEHSEL